MTIGLIIVVVLVVLLLGLVGFFAAMYNSLVRLNIKAGEAWSGITVQLKRRADLIPNLVEAAKMTGIQEQEVFGQIADARSKLLGAGQAASAEAKTPEQRQAMIDANNSFGGTIGRLLSLQESYPQLRSAEAFQNLMTELAGTENRMNIARLDYNDAVQAYNTERSQFPGVITASLFGFKEEPYFKAEEGAKTAPKLPSADTLRKNTAPANK